MNTDSLNKGKKIKLSSDNSKTQPTKNKFNIPQGNITYFFAFFIPLVILIAVYIIRGIFPFGSSCYLRTDMYHQYAPFFSELWNKLRNGGSLTYSWDIGMGTNFTSLYAYYLASPSNWFIALFPQKYLIEIMSVIILIKLALSSVTFTYYLSKHFKTKSFMLAIFGVFYSLSGYTTAYSWNIMWLDCILLLPLIMLGLERLVNENKCFLYCISLGMCIYTNYYISIMVCISVVFYFIVLIISYNGNRKPVIYFKKTAQWAFYSLLAGGLSACLLLPEIYTFSLSASSTMSFPSELTQYFSVLNVLTRQLMDIPIHLGLDHFPNIYCGVAVFLLIPLYVMDKKIPSREKIGKVALLAIFIISFNLNIPNFIWHGFRYPNSLPCRQGFIYVFFVLSMGYEALKHLKDIPLKKLTGSLWIAIAFLLIIEQVFTTDKTYDFNAVYISAIFIIAYAILMYLYKKYGMKYQIIILLAFTISIFECTINLEDTGVGTTNRDAYLMDYDAIKEVSNYVADNDNSFYRMDKITGARSKNDGAWHNYKSISTFSSTSSAGMSDLFGHLGFEHSTNAYGYNGATAVTNSLFSVKYVISNKHLAQSPLQSPYTASKGEFIYENNYTLPIAYMAGEDINNNWNPSSSCDGIQNQNSLVETLTGISNVFTLTYQNFSDNEVSFSPVKDGHMYLTVQNSSNDSVKVKINSCEVSYDDFKNNNRIIDIGYLHPTDCIEVSADSTINLSAYTLETDRFVEAYNILTNSALSVDKFSDTYIHGNLNTPSDGTLLFSIPYDAGWSVYVDGQKTDSYAVKDALLGVFVTAGQHEISLKYMPVNLIKGCIITFICIIILIAIFIINRLRRNNKISTNRLPAFIQTLISFDDIIISNNKATKPKADNCTNRSDDNLSEKIKIQVKQKKNTLSDSFDIDALDDFDNIELQDDDSDSY